MDLKTQTPIIGQEAICPDGLGRVISFSDDLPAMYVQVRTYANDQALRWVPSQVELVPIQKPVPVGAKVLIDENGNIKLTDMNGDEFNFVRCGHHTLYILEDN
jgi:hypothetical protein